MGSRTECPPFTDEHLRLLAAAARRMALRWCRSASDADDIAQEAMLRLLHHDAPLEAPLAWLFVVTRRLSNRLRLNNERRRLAEASDHSLLTPAPRFTVFDFQLILRRLPPRDRRLLELVINGATACDIARVFTCHSRDVGQMVSRARAKARRIRDQPGRPS